MRAKVVEQVVKSSLVYGYAVTQPFLLSTHSDVISVPHEPDHSTVPKQQNPLQEPLHHRPSTQHTDTYHYLQASSVKGKQSSHQIKVSEQNTKKMQENLMKEKQQQFKKVASDIQVIDYGESSRHVKKVQKKLADYNYYTGELDGIYGDLTEKALQMADRDNVLPEPPTKTAKKSEKDASKSIETNISDKEVETKPIKVKQSNPDIIETAKTFMGTPYVWGGTSPNGFDCSGFIQFVYSEEDQTIPRTVREIWNFASETSKPSIGDLIFFETYEAGPSHLGIYLGNGDFIHAGSSSGVTISNYKDNPYWSERYIGAKTIN